MMTGDPYSLLNYIAIFTGLAFVDRKPLLAYALVDLIVYKG